MTSGQVLLIWVKTIATLLIAAAICRAIALRRERKERRPPWKR